MEELLNPNWYIGSNEIREILLHMLFRINVNKQNVLHMKKRVHAKPQKASLKTEKKSRIDYQ